jgi:hypothetical protein
MSQESSKEMLERFRSQDTPELIELLKGKVKANENDEVLNAIQQVLETRQARFPDMSKMPSPMAKQKETRALAADSNALVSSLEPEKIEISFPKQGFMRCDRSEFKSQAELASYIAEVFSLPGKRGSARLGVKRKGKYQRIDRTGRPIYTFGDPILDLITDEHGWITVGKETYHLLPLDLASPQNRKGGITGIDLSVNHEEIRRQQLAEALAVNGTRTLIEHTGDQLIVATTNPSQLDFWKGSAHMRFRSWKTNYYIYRSIGTEIETWGGDFSRAEIQSTYADPVLDTNPFICFIVKFDSDSDTNDDYVDEYEYGIAASTPNTVRSFCQARWKGQLFSGTVSKGDCQTFLGG